MIGIGIGLTAMGAAVFITMICYAMKMTSIW